jgi:tripartite-type tricarboxylate transporter receptor subunit TctC
VELGVVDTPANYWMGLFAPPGLPAPVLTRLRDATMNVLGSPEWAEFAAKGAGEAGPHTPEQFNRLLASEQRRWADVIRRNNIRAT